jgi:hypothetical protein
LSLDRGESGQSPDEDRCAEEFHARDGETSALCVLKVKKKEENICL